MSHHSSVRDESQTLDEFLRKQRVVRFMQSERERAARARVEREEHSEWVNLRSMERAEVIKHLTDVEITRLLQREALEIEKERLETEEAVKRGAEAAMERRRVVTNARRLTADRGSGTEFGEAGSLMLEGRAESEGLSTSARMSTKLISDVASDRMGDIIVKLYRAQEDVIALKSEAKGIRNAHRLAEEKMREEAERADKEMVARRKAESLTKRYEKEVEQLRQKIKSLGTSPRAGNEGKATLPAKERDDALAASRARIKALENENKVLREKYEQLHTESNELAERLKEAAEAKAKKRTQAGVSGTPREGPSPREQLAQLQRVNEELKMKESRLTSEILILQKSVEEHKNVLLNASDENMRLKKRLQTAAATKKKLEEVARKALEEKQKLPSKEELDRAHREIRRLKRELDEARKEIKSLRESFAHEVTSLKELCARLRSRNNRQIDELKRFSTRRTSSPPPSGRREGSVRSLGCSMSNSIDTVTQTKVAAVTKLQVQLRELQGRLQESIRTSAVQLPLLKRFSKKKQLVLLRAKRMSLSSVR
ncbi:hypothetical protein ERJ75_000351100 [Trypanosoma vivax]|nr:hypothetical protein ERJ75_000351100 [Trypanosoma vivax]